MTKNTNDKTTWILLADEGIARVMQRKGASGPLHEVEAMTDAAAHASAADLQSDQQGRRNGGGSLGGGAGAGSGGSAIASAGDTPEHKEAIVFARRVGKWLHEAHNQGRFDELQVAAAPRFLGLLRKEYTPQVQAAVTKELDKDLNHLDANALLQRFFPSEEASS